MHRGRAASPARIKLLTSHSLSSCSRHHAARTGQKRSLTHTRKRVSMVSALARRCRRPNGKERKAHKEADFTSSMSGFEVEFLVPTIYSSTCCTHTTLEPRAKPVRALPPLSLPNPSQPNQAVRTHQQICRFHCSSWRPDPFSLPYSLYSLSITQSHNVIAFVSVMPGRSPLTL